MKILRNKMTEKIKLVFFMAMVALPLNSTAHEENEMPPLETSEGRVHYELKKEPSYGMTRVHIERINQLCGDIDGCSLRLKMIDYQNNKAKEGTATYPFAAAEALFAINTDTSAWRMDDIRAVTVKGGDTVVDQRDGSNNENGVEGILSAWSCTFTDGTFKEGKPHSDTNDEDFWLVNHEQDYFTDGTENTGHPGYRTGCRLTIID